MTHDQYSEASKIKIEIDVLNSLLSKYIMEEHIKKFPEFIGNLQFDQLEREISGFIYNRVQKHIAELESKLKEI